MWRLGARWGVLGRAAVEQGALEATAMPFLAALGKTSGENVYLRVRDGLESETIAIYQADPGLRIYSEVGKRQPLHAGSSRMLLAHAPEAVQTQVLAQRLPRFTPATRTDAAWIAADLQRIRTRGYLLTTDEVVAGAATVAAPVRDASGQVVAVLSVSAPTMRMRPPRPRALLPMVLDAALRLSRALGDTAARTVDATRKAQGAASAPGRETPPPHPPSPPPDLIRSSADPSQLQGIGARRGRHWRQPPCARCPRRLPGICCWYRKSPEKLDGHVRQNHLRSDDPQRAADHPRHAADGAARH